MSKEITIKDVKKFIENDASHSDIDEIWSAIKDEVEPDDDTIRDLVNSTSYLFKQELAEDLSDIIRYESDVEYDDIEQYVLWNASAFQKKKLYKQLRESLNLQSLEDIDEDYCFVVKTLNDYYKLKIVKEVFDQFTSEEFEKRLKKE